MPHISQRGLRFNDDPDCSRDGPAQLLNLRLIELDLMVLPNAGYMMLAVWKIEPCVAHCGDHVALRPARAWPPWIWHVVRHLDMPWLDRGRGGHR